MKINENKLSGLQRIKPFRSNPPALQKKYFNATVFFSNQIMSFEFYLNSEHKNDIQRLCFET